MNPRGIVLLSGGLDSATLLAMARKQGYIGYALSFRYGQRHVMEIDNARRIAQAQGAADHIVLDIDLASFGGSALTSDIAVPKDRSPAAMERGIPVTYVPARNTIFLSLALAWGETLGVSDIFIGVNALDYSGYPDCRPEFIEGFEQLANLATKAGVEGSRFRVHAPLMRMSKADIVREGLRLGVDFSQTVSCYQADAEGRACRHCDACRLRAQGFDEAGVPDPTRYVDGAIG